MRIWYMNKKNHHDFYVRLVIDGNKLQTEEKSSNWLKINYEQG